MVPQKYTIFTSQQHKRTGVSTSNCKLLSPSSPSSRSSLSIYTSQSQFPNFLFPLYLSRSFCPSVSRSFGANTTMARSLSQTLVRIAPLSRSKASPPIRLINVRNRSNQSAKFNNMETVEFNSDGGETERIAVQKLEDAIHKLIVRRSQPDWLPFLPGASYWVPPKSKARGFAEVINKLASSSNKEAAMSLSNNRGWPSSEYFLKGASPSPIEVRTNKKKKFPSEDEEG